MPARIYLLSKTFPILKPGLERALPRAGPGRGGAPIGGAVRWLLPRAQLWATAALRKRMRAGGEWGLGIREWWEGKGCGEEP